ncbi:hydrolase [Sulfurovum lithotrophicum]|uniref:phosphoglycolate phosphatase n=1 Tax=Sulfurovum lithotrophicum TaxID=206403 RepID=A0A7U4M2K0_9BACT|nr:HAD family hydrolase [Sulfurovum lithotrophicum]AKF25690.1 hydrolase [Sulfurovum lithotrophicum]
MTKETIILFDLDGTLIDSTEAILESFAVAFKQFEEEVPEDELIKAQIGHPLDWMFLKLGVEEEKIWDHVAAYKQHYRKISKAKTVLLPSAKEAVERASEFAMLGVVTTKTAEYSIELLEHMGLMDYFDVLIGRENVEHPKPHPEPIYKALERLPHPPEGEIWMIGDTCMDMHAATSAKIKGVAVSCGYGTVEQLSKCSDLLCKNSLEAVTFIAKK